MLVMSRRQDQRFVFPQLGITVSLLNISGNSARIGVDAPRHIKVLREEILDSETVPCSTADSHQMRNVLNSVNLFTMVYQRQIQACQRDEAAATFMKFVAFLEEKVSAGLVDFEVDPIQPTDHPTVMVVEDDRDQRELLGSFLELNGYRPSLQEDGKAAFTALQSLDQPPSAILLDWSMPQYGGAWFLERVANQFGAKRPKVLVLSGMDSVRPQHMTGVDAWLPKPLNQTALLARLRAAGFATAS